MIHHLLPGRAEHHIPVIIQFFLDIHEALRSPINEHVFVFYGATPEQSRAYAAKLPAGCRTIFIKKGKVPLFKYVLGFHTADSLILHSAFYPWIWVMLLLFPRMWKKTSWVMWGADIYGKDTWKGRLYLRLKGIVVRRLGAVSALVPGDFADLQRLIGPCKNYVRAFYSPTFEREMRARMGQPLCETGRAARIVLGNSAWDQNDHIPALEWLRRFEDRAFEVICPLGYPKESAYKSQVIAAGRELLGTRFKPLENMLNRDDYHELLSTCDVFVLNSRNQQGLGNIYYMLLNGGKVFVRGDSSTYSMLKDFGFHIYDTREIQTMTFEELISFTPELAEHNRSRYRQHLSTEASIKDWSIFLTRIEALKLAA